jgi:hypothetical protein
MECSGIEEKLSEYLERSLPAQDMERVAEHLNECTQCSALLDEMRSIVLTCKGFPTLEPDVALIERILLRTSGKLRTRSWRELVTQYLVGPMLTPRFAVGAVLSVLFLAFALNLLLPRMSVVASVLSPRELVREMDKGVQHIYSEGLRAYDKKNEWQAQFGFIKNNVFNKLGFMIEQLDVPVEGNKKKSGEPRQQQEKAPSDKSSLLLLPA